MSTESDEFEPTEPTPTPPTFTPLSILDAQSHVEIYSDYIRVQNSSLLRFIEADSISFMPPLHRQQLIQLRTGYDNKSYFSRSDFGMLVAIFTRYTEALKERNSDNVAFITNFNRSLLEAASFENRIQELLKQQQHGAAAKNEQGNFVVIQLTADQQPPQTSILTHTPSKGY